jgi:hypothetical protein
MSAHSSSRDPHHKTSRRQFLGAAGAGAIAAAVGPTILHATDKSGSKPALVGSGEHQYECFHNWGELPRNLRWGFTHGVAVDSAGLVYIKHQLTAVRPMDAVVVFDKDGKYVRSFAKECHAGGHGIDVRQEGGEEFLYLSDIAHRFVAKTSLTGEFVWKLTYPPEAGVYENDKQFRPTNIAFAPDGGFYVGDGYGLSYIHQYDANAKWVRTWGGKGQQQDRFTGGPGSEPGKLSTPHGLWLDDRPGREPSLIVADRANMRMQYFTLDGQHLSFMDGMAFPANIDIRGADMLIPELFARLSLYDAANQVTTRLGDDPEWAAQVTDPKAKVRISAQPDKWREGRFVHPHDACFDAEGNIFVVEWVPTGRVSFLRRVS